MSSNDFYIMFFNFPLRTNGIFSNACQNTGGTALGNAYYHQYLWVIVCDFTVNNLGAPSGWGIVGRTMRITNFYTPWFYLGSG
jgi:hypothetical protein